MIYSLQLEDGTVFPLNSDAVTVALKGRTSLSDTVITKESNLVERSYGDGAAKVGSSRLAMGELTIFLTLAFQSDAECRLYINQLFYALRNAVYLIDVTNAIRTKVDLSSPSITWHDGAYYRFGDGTIVLNQLTPYWESLNATTVTTEIEAGVPTEINIENSGYAETPFTVEFTLEESAGAVAYAELQNIEEGRSIRIESASFGVSGYTVLSVDTAEGTAKLINEVYSSELDVQDAFEAGSGYYDLVVGANVLSARCASAAVVTVAYRARYYA